jgi:coenzyme F420 hydrogenase subunit beta
MLQNVFSEEIVKRICSHIYVMAKRPKVFGHLLVEVIRPERCVACGSCVSICPVDAISFDGLPKLTGKCTACGDCYTACPRVEHDFGESEVSALGRNRSTDEAAHGILLGAYAVRTLLSEVKKHAQDGGAVTSILLSCLDEGTNAVVAGLDKEKTWFPVPVLAKDNHTVIECAGTKYTSAPMLLAVKQAEKEGLKKLAFVGTPCQIHALRRRQKNSPKTDTLALGLFCMETFDYDKLMAYLKDQGVDPEKVKKFEIKSGKFIAHKEGEPPFEVKIRKLKELSRTCCRVCLDYTSELADLSIGNVGSPDGYSTVLVRTEKGEASLRATEKKGLIDVKPLKDYQPGMSLVDRLSDMKKKENSGKPLDQ